MSGFAGVDSSKSSFDVSLDGTVLKVERSPKSVRKLLRALPEGTCLVMEATAKLHLMLADAAYEAGFTVYVVNPADFARYRESVNYRVKSDAVDAQILARYGEREHDRLRRYVPQDKLSMRVRELLGLRDQLVESRVAISQSLSQITLLDSLALKEVELTLAQMSRNADAIEVEIHELLSSNPVYIRLLRLPGIGPITAAALTWALSRGTFENRDKFVAFIGMDVRIRESGMWKGRRKLTKRGDPLLRKLLYMGASSLRASAAWKGRFASLEARGISKVASTVIVARQIARNAYAHSNP